MTSERLLELQATDFREQPHAACVAVINELGAEVSKLRTICNENAWLDGPEGQRWAEQMNARVAHYTQSLAIIESNFWVRWLRRLGLLIY